MRDLDSRIAAAQSSHDRAQLLDQMLDEQLSGEATSGEHSERIAAASKAALRRLTVATDAETCGTQDRKVVALPPDDSGQIAVYLLNFPGTENAVPLGGHFRVMIGADDQAGPLETLTDGCDIAAWDPEDAQLMMRVYVTEYALDDHPTEIHSLISKRLPMSMGVITGDIIWPMAGGYFAPPVPAAEAGY